MKRKELKTLAKKIALAEQKLDSATDSKEQQKYQNEIIELSGHIKDYNDIFLLDGMIQEILEKKS